MQLITEEIGQASSSDESQKELYIIQRCWYSGPHINDPPMDCIRLFKSRREAEEVAHFSAHAYATSKNKPGVVRTILMPNVVLPDGQSVSSYAFQTCGKLFWVRAALATYVSTPPSSSFQAMIDAQRQQHSPASHCKAVLTYGVIGGTGNTNSRRGVEVRQGRIFLGHEENIVNKCAYGVAQSLQSTLSHPANENISIQPIPIGKPPEYNHEHYSIDWRNTHHSFQQNNDHLQFTQKREFVNAIDNSEQPSKRICFVQQQQQQQHFQNDFSTANIAGF